MCELFCLCSRLPTTTTFSLETFARRGGDEGPVDGWGLVLHDGRDMRLYKEPEPAARSAWLTYIQGRQLPSRLVLSHIRRATQGGVSLANTQPFARELGGRMHVFAHNGRLDGIESRHAGGWQRFKPLGDTDSEVAFCALLERLSGLWSNGAIPPVDQRLAVVDHFAAEMRDLGPANFLYADGDTLFAHADRRIQPDGTIKSPGLWRLSRHCVEAGALSETGVTVELGGQPQDVVLFASVPLSGEEWTPLRRGEVFAVRDGCVLASTIGSGR